ncbi:L-fucose:H+ symporter permease [soil metagenome]
MDATEPVKTDPVAGRLFRASIGVFFLGGFLTSTVSLLVPRLKLTLGLGYADALLIQLAFHSSYLLFAIPIAFIIVRIGYMRAITVGLGVMAASCAALTAAYDTRYFLPVLGALLMLSAGITFLQIASNTVVTLIGPAHRAAARLTLLQGFNSLGTVLGPLLCAPFLLADLVPEPETIGGNAVAVPFLASALGLAILATLFFRNRNLLPAATTPSAAPRTGQLLAVMADRRLFWGTTAIFAYVGAEVTIGTLLTNFLMLPERLGATPVTAGSLVSLYWGGAMIGRFGGAWLLDRLSGPRLLLLAAIGAAALTMIASIVPGLPGAAALILVGLCNAIMYPTIYALALPTEADAAPLGSMWLCMAVVGGAVVPLATGSLADLAGLLPALLLPSLCYGGIALFAAAALPRPAPLKSRTG